MIGISKAVVNPQMQKLTKSMNRLFNGVRDVMTSIKFKGSISKLIQGKKRGEGGSLVPCLNYEIIDIYQQEHLDVYELFGELEHWTIRHQH